MLREHRVIVFVDDGDDANARPATTLTFYPETGVFGFDDKLFTAKHTKQPNTSSCIITALIRTVQPPTVSPILWVEYMAVQDSSRRSLDPPWCVRLVALIGGFDLLSSLLLTSVDRQLRRIQRWWVRHRPVIRNAVRMLVNASLLNEDCGQHVLQACWRRMVAEVHEPTKLYAFSWTDIEVTCTILLHCTADGTVTHAHWWMLDGRPNVRYSTSYTETIPWLAKAYKCAKRLTIHQQQTSSQLDCTVVTFLHFFLRSDTTIICTEWRRQILVLPNEMLRRPSPSYYYRDRGRKANDFSLIDRAATAAAAELS